MLDASRLRFERGRYDAGADWFGEIEFVAGLSSSFGENAIGMDRAGHDQAVFWLVIRDRMTSGDDNARLGGLVGATLEDLGDHMFR